MKRYKKLAILAKVRDNERKKHPAWNNTTSLSKGTGFSYKVVRNSLAFLLRAGEIKKQNVIYLVK